MFIRSDTNNFSNYTTNSNTNHNTTNTENISFDSMVQNINKIEKPEEKGKYLTYMDQFNYFDSLNEKDRQTIRDILRDDKITLKEIDSLSYDQAQKLAKYASANGEFPLEHIAKVPIIYHDSNQIVDMFAATKFTNSKTFNESLYRTFREVDDDISRSKIFNKVSTAISKVLSSETKKDITNQWEWNLEKMNINFNLLLNNIISNHEEELKNPQGKPKDYLEQHQDSLNLFNLLKNNYDNVQKQSRFF